MRDFIAHLRLVLRALLTPNETTVIWHDGKRWQSFNYPPSWERQDFKWLMKQTGLSHYYARREYVDG